jgi:hypothetical protein
MIPTSRESIQKLNAMGRSGRGEEPPKPDEHAQAMKAVALALLKLTAQMGDTTLSKQLERIAEAQQLIVDSMQKQAARRKEFTFEVTSRDQQGYAKTVKVVENK